MRLFGSSKLPAFIDRKTKAVARTFNFYWDHFDARLHALEELKVTWQAATADIITHGLRRIDDAIRPTLDKVINLTTLGFLTATSAAESTLELGEVLYLTLDEGVQRELFTPTPFLAVTREGSYEDWAIGRFLQYNVEIGELRVEILYIHGNPGPHSDWVVASSSGIPAAVANMLEDVTAKHGEVVEAADTLEAASAIIANGPVSAINGKAGIVTLQAHEIPLQGGGSSVQEALAGKATAADIAAAIDALIGGAPGALNTLGELAQALADDANFAAAMTAALAGKADKATTYTKTEIDSRFAPIEAAGTTSSISPGGTAAADFTGINTNDLDILGIAMSHGDGASRSLEVYFSTNNGSSWTLLGTWGQNALTAANLADGFLKFSGLKNGRLTVEGHAALAGTGGPTLNFNNNLNHYGAGFANPGTQVNAIRIAWASGVNFDGGTIYARAKN